MYAYSFANIVLTVNGTIIDNYAEGDDAVKVEPLVDAASTKVGADGHMVASISANRGCKVAIKLQQTSPGNYIMQNLYNLQIAQSARFQPISMSVKDAMKQDACTCIGGIITKQSVWQRGANANDTEWEMTFENYTVNAGIQAELASVAPAITAAAGIPVAGLGL